MNFCWIKNSVLVEWNINVYWIKKWNEIKFIENYCFWLEINYLDEHFHLTKMNKYVNFVLTIWWSSISESIFNLDEKFKYLTNNQLFSFQLKFKFNFK
jgi:hypothetical protein